MSDSDSHESGCFPCRRGKKKRQQKVAAEVTANPVCIAEPKQSVPTTKSYALEATKQTIEILKGVAGLSPVPLVKDILELGLNIISTCHQRRAEQSCQPKNRITGFLLVIAKFMKDPDNEKSASKLANDLDADLSELKDCLALITAQLNSIKDQNRLLTGLLSQPNLELIDDCEIQFQDRISRFQTLLGLHAAQDLAVIPQQLVKFRRNGPGGMGKTSTALAIMEHALIQKHFTREHKFWVPCITANSPTNFLALLSKHVRAERKTDDTLDNIVSSLQETTDPCIIILDNFETPWHPVEGSQYTIKLALEALDALPHVAILITMRSEFSPFERWKCEHLAQIQPEDSRKIYTAIDTSAANHPEPDELLDALGHLPYAITLMASRGKRSFANPLQLLREWKEIGTSMLSKPDEGIDHSISLSIDSNFVSRSPDAIRLLQVLSMLPAGVYHEYLSIWAEGWRSEAVDTLRDAALVLAREVVVGPTTKIHLFVLPVVQSHMTQHRRIPEGVQHQVFNACYRFLLEHSATIQGPNDSRFQQHAIPIMSQETNIQALLTRTIKDSLSPYPSPPYNDASTMTTTKEQIRALLAFAWYQHWTKPRPEIAERCLTLARNYKVTRYEADALFCLGSIRWLVNQLDGSREVLTSAQALFEEMGDELMALRSELMDVDLDVEWGDFNRARQRMENCRSRRGDRFVENPVCRAWFLYQWGTMNWGEDGLADLKEAQRLFEDLNPPGKLQIALCRLAGARIHASLGDTTAALHVIDASIAGFNALYGESLTSEDRSSADLLKGRFLKLADRWDAELDATLRTALLSYQEVGLSLGIAQCLVEFAEIYVRNNDWPAAKLAYEEAIKKCARMDDYTSTWLVKAAQQNLQYIEFAAAEDPAGVPVAFCVPDRH